MKFMLISGAGSPLMMNLISIFKKEFHIFALDSSSSILEQFKDDRDVTPFVCDICNAIRIKQIRTEINKITNELDVIINFIDELILGSVLELDSNKIEKTYSSNVLGIYRINQIFFQYVRTAKGKIININNNEIQYKYLPFTFAYNSYKNNLELYSEYLRKEAKHYGVKIINISTNLSKQNHSSNLNSSLSKMHNETKLYKESVKKLKGMIDIKGRNNNLNKTQEVIKKVVMSSKPKDHYSIGNRYTVTLFNLLPSSFQESLLNRRLFKKEELDKETLSLIKESKKIKVEKTSPLILNKGTIKSIEAGIEGEDSVYKILKKHTKQIYRNVVILKKKATFFSEIDFVCFIHNRLLLIEAKNWYGKVENTKTGNKVRVSCINLKGNFSSTLRDDPYLNLIFFLKDFSKYLNYTGENINKHDSIYRYVVFTKDELNLAPYHVKNPSELGCLGKLKDFEKFLNELSHMKPCKPIISKDNELPTWDIGHNKKEKSWHHIVLLGLNIEVDKKHYDTSNIDFIHLLDEQNVVIRLLDKTIIKGKLTKELEINKHLNILETGITFIKLNKALHSK